MRRGTPAAEIFGQYLRDLRTEYNISMRQLAMKIGVPTSTVSQIEKGQRALKEPRISDWANALGVSEKTVRYRWRKVQIDHPDPPLVRRRGKSITLGKFADIINELTGPERDRVYGYIEAVIENRHLNA